MNAPNTPDSYRGSIPVFTHSREDLVTPRPSVVRIEGGVTPPPSKVSADIFNPNPSYVPGWHRRPQDKIINTESPSLAPMHGLRVEDFDSFVTQKAANLELHGYDPKRFLRIREFFLRVALKDEDELAKDRKSAELLTAKVWNEAAAASSGSTPFALDGPVHQSKWYQENGSPDLKLMRRHSRARWVASGFSGHGGIARLQHKAKFVANAEQQPASRAVKRAKLNGDTSHNAKKNSKFLHTTEHHVHHANHEAVDRIKGTEHHTLKNPIKKLGAPIRNRGKLANQIKIEQRSNIRKQKIEKLVQAQVAKMPAKEHAKQQRTEAKDARKQARQDQRAQQQQPNTIQPTPNVAPTTSNRQTRVPRVPQRPGTPPRVEAFTAEQLLENMSGTLKIVVEGNEFTDALIIKKGTVKGVETYLVEYTDASGSRQQAKISAESLKKRNLAPPPLPPRRTTSW